jgi:hypothetical protein
MNFDSVEGFLGGTVTVHSTSGRGFTPEELAERALDKIVYVGSKSHPVIRDQAEAFKNNLRVVLIQYLHQAVRSDRTTIANRLREAGHPELTILLND